VLNLQKKKEKNKTQEFKAKVLLRVLILVIKTP